MPILNPNEPLRAAYVQAMEEATGLPVWAKKVPKDSAIPNQYIIISTQVKNAIEQYKNLNDTPLVADRFEWQCTINIEIINANIAGFGDPAVNDIVEGQIVDRIQSGIDVDGFHIKSYEFFGSVDLDIETDTQSVERRVITYQHWLWQR